MYSLVNPINVRIVAKNINEVGTYHNIYNYSISNFL